MKKLKIYKSAIALLVGAFVLLLSGCSSTNNSSNGANKEEKNSSCTHLTIYLEEGPITFKECEEYTIDAWDSDKGDELYYDIEKEGKKIFLEGITAQYNMYEVEHHIVNEQIDIESVQKYR